MCLPPVFAIAGGLLSAAGSVLARNAQAAAYEAQAGDKMVLEVKKDANRRRHPRDLF